MTEVVPAGMSVAQYAAVRAIAAKRAKYGGNICSERGRAQASMKTKAWLRRVGHWNSNKTRCKYGHQFAPWNTRRTLRDGRWERSCIECQRRRNGTRPEWVTTPDGVKVYVRARDRAYRRQEFRLRKAMLSAHPDKGGTTIKFSEARARFKAFEAREAKWYGALGLRSPERRRGKVKRGT